MLNRMPQRVVVILAVVLIISWILSAPAAAGDDVHNWVQSLGTFFSHLTH